MRCSFSALLLCIGLFSQAAGAAVCPSKDLIKQEKIVLIANQAQVVLIEKHHAELNYTLFNLKDEKLTSPITGGSPQGNNGPEFIYLAAQEYTQNFLVCINSRYRDRTTTEQQNESPSIRKVNKGEMSEARFTAMIKLSQAGQAWTQHNQKSHQLASELYLEAYQASSEDKHLSHWSGLYYLRSQVLRYNFHTASRFLERLTEKNNSFKKDNELKAAHNYPLMLEKAKILIREARYPRSIDALHKALALTEIIPEQPIYDKAEINNLLAEAYFSTGKIEIGKQHLQTALKQSEGRPQLLGKIYNNTGYLELLKSFATNGKEREQHLQKSIDWHIKAQQESAFSGDYQELSIIENNLGSLYERRGELRKSRDHFSQALLLINDKDEPLRTRILYQNLGKIYQYLGDYKKSQVYLKRAIAMGATAAPTDKSKLQCLLGNTYRLMGDYKNAFELHKVCLTSAITAENQALQLLATFEIAQNHLQQGNTTKAREVAAKLVFDLEKNSLKDGDLYLQSLIQQSKINRLLKQLDQAGIAINKALNSDQKARYSNTAVDISAEAMHYFHAEGNISKAIKHAKSALSKIEKMHIQLDAERLGPSWSARSHNIYTSAIQLILQRYQQTKNVSFLQQALDITEQSRATSLRLGFSKSENARKNISDSDLKNKNLLEFSRLANARAGGSAEQSKDIAKYYQQHELLDKQKNTTLGTATLRPAIDHNAIQSHLSEKKIAVYYLLSHKEAYAFVVAKENLKLINLGASKVITQHANDCHKTLSAKKSGAYACLRKLSQLLIKPLNLASSIESLLVLPHKALHSVPFSALSKTPFEPRYQALSDDLNITTALSLSHYFETKNVNKSAVDLAIFANPLFKNQVDSSPYNTQEQPTIVREAYRSWSENLAALPWSQQEAEKLQKVFRQHNVVSHLGPNASRENLQSVESRNAKILHIASHGYFDPASPDNIGFALSAESNTGQAGFITLSELFSYQFSNQLVVINGCDTAMGEQMSGEGMLGLSRGFLSQGAGHVISTLWPVSDKASALFMELFYQKLHESERIDTALAYAQKQLRFSPGFSHPFYWAPYSLKSAIEDTQLKFQTQH